MALLSLYFPTTKRRQNTQKHDAVCIVLLCVCTVEMCANTAVEVLNDSWMLLYTLFIYISAFSFPSLRVIFPFIL